MSSDDDLFQLPRKSERVTAPKAKAPEAPVEPAPVAEPVTMMASRIGGKVPHEINVKREELRVATEELAARKEKQIAMRLARKEEENKAYQRAQEITALNLEIFSLRRSMSELEITIEDLKYDRSKSFFKFAKKKTFSEQIAEKNKELAPLKEKLAELSARKKELVALPSYEEVIDQQNKAKEDMEHAVEEQQAIVAQLTAAIAGLEQKKGQLAQ